MLANARPRLVRLACLRGLAPDAAEDVAQETLLIAWRSLDRLRQPERFDAWLDGVCRNLCRRYARVRRDEQACIVAAGEPQYDDQEPDADFAPGADSQSFASGDDFDTLTADLSRQELATLLDRALGQLSPGARSAIEGYYLLGESQREAALRLGLTVNALETRLSRARQELRRILSGPLRDEALAFDIAVDDEAAQGWRTTRLWCHLCGKHHLMGRIEETPQGTSVTSFCPDCRRRYGVIEMRSDPSPLLDGMRSFRPAINRIIRLFAPQALQVLREAKPCPGCRGLMRTSVVSGQELSHWRTGGFHPTLYYLVVECASCGQGFAGSAFIAGWEHPSVRAFLTRTHWTIERNEPTSYQNGEALQSTFRDHATGERLTLFSHPANLTALATTDA